MSTHRNRKRGAAVLESPSTATKQPKISQSTSSANASPSFMPAQEEKKLEFTPPPSPSSIRSPLRAAPPGNYMEIIFSSQRIVSMPFEGVSFSFSHTRSDRRYPLYPIKFTLNSQSVWLEPVSTPKFHKSTYAWGFVYFALRGDHSVRFVGKCLPVDDLEFTAVRKLNKMVAPRCDVIQAAAITFDTTPAFGFVIMPEMDGHIDRPEFVDFMNSLSTAARAACVKKIITSVRGQLACLTNSGIGIYNDIKPDNILYSFRVDARGQGPSQASEDQFVVQMGDLGSIRPIGAKGYMTTIPCYNGRPSTKRVTPMYYNGVLEYQWLDNDADAMGCVHRVTSLLLIYLFKKYILQESETSLWRPQADEQALSFARKYAESGEVYSVYLALSMNPDLKELASMLVF